MATITRRGFCMGLAALPAIHVRRTEAAEPPYAGAIDMHCHVFNTDDLPVSGFFRFAFLEAEEGGLFDPPKALLGFVVELVGRAAPSATAEIEALGGPLLAPGPSGDRQQDVIFTTRLSEQIERLAASADGPALFASPGPDAPGRDDAQELLQILEQIAGPVTPDLVPSLAPAPGQSLQPGDLGRRAPGTMAQMIAHRLDQVQRAPVPGLQGVLGIGSAVRSVVRALAWAKLMISSRRTIIDRYRSLFGGPSGVAMITPALVDFEGWLGSTAAPGSSLRRQMELMSLLSRRESGIVIHGIAPYDPLRDVMGHGTESFDLVRDAIEDHGFVGIKIYPPMGFLPYGNTASGLDFEKSIRRELSNETLREALDERLKQLFIWAADSQRRIPILAHARESYGGRPGYAQRAHPSGWDPVAGRHPGLQIALAHFGDFEPASNATVWEHDMVVLMKERRSVYADLSYLVSAMGESLSRKEEKAQKLAAFALRSEQVLFGTDWSFIALAEGYENYLPGLDVQLERAGFGRPARQDVFRNNALRFLGLRDGEPGRDRLLRFYDCHQLNRDRLLAVIG